MKLFLSCDLLNILFLDNELCLLICCNEEDHKKTSAGYTMVPLDKFSGACCNGVEWIADLLG